MYKTRNSHAKITNSHENLTECFALSLGPMKLKDKGTAEVAEITGVYNFAGFPFPRFHLVTVARPFLS